MIYTEFAQFYDDLFDESLYDRWLTYTMDRISNSKKPNNDIKILDLACGTGRLAVKLAKSGYQVDGADLSPDMLTLADQRAQQTNSNVMFIQADMRDLSDLDNYDVITCFDDSLNYLISQEDFQKTLNSVSQHLNPGGKFLFDVITPYQVTDIYPGYMYNYRTEDSAFMWTSYEGDFAPAAVEHDLSFFSYNAEKDAYDAYSELHQERAYDHDELMNMLMAGGFRDLKFTTDFGNKPFAKQVKRWFVESTKG